MNEINQVRLEKVSYENVREIRRLHVAEDQKNFVATNDWSLIQAYLTLANGAPVFPFGIYHGETLVGFIMVNYDNDWTGYERDVWLNSDDYRFYKDKNYYCIWRFMIDEAYQHRGYGKAALLRAIEFIKTFPCGEAEYCILSYEPENHVAKKLYSSVGFQEIDGPGYYEEGDEVTAVLKL